MRESFGLEPEEPKEKRYTPDAIFIGSASQLLNDSDKLAEVLKHDVKDGSEFYDLVETAEKAPTLDVLRARLKEKGYGDSAEANAFWAAAQEVLGEIRRETQRASEAQRKAAEPVPAAPPITPAQATAELDEIHSGRRGSPTTAANRARRKALAQALRESLERG